MAIVILSGAASGLQTDLPGYASSIENSVPAGVETQLQHLTGEHANSFADKQSKELASSLPNLGPAPNFAGITGWLDTPGDRPLSLTSLRGKVVLIDFWTYSCINCRRSLPHVEAWYRSYHKDGLVVVGVHTPEFAFEHVESNIAAAARSLGVTYPIAIDNNYGTWDAYNNEYWPAEYLIDQNGDVRHTSFGEGDYAKTESDIRALLLAGGAKQLPKPTDIPNTEPTQATTPESYLGYQRLDNAVNPISDNSMTGYQLPSQLPLDELAFGGHWNVHGWEATAGNDAVLQLSYQATDVYLVLGGHGTVRVSRNGLPLATVRVEGYPDLYTLLAGTSSTEGELTLKMSPGVRAYDFTFG